MTTMKRDSVSLLIITAIAAVLVVIGVALMGFNRSPAPLQLTTSTIPASQVTEVITPAGAITLADDSTPIPTNIVMETITPASLPTNDGTPPHSPGEPTQRPLRVEAAGEWDVVVLGRIDVCFLCQRGSPSVTYTQVLAGKIPNGQTEGMLALAGVAAHLLPEDGVPIYESQQAEIVFLKRVVAPDHEDQVVYTVVDIMKATPENLALFLGQ